MRHIKPYNMEEILVKKIILGVKYSENNLSCTIRDSEKTFLDLHSDLNPLQSLSSSSLTHIMSLHPVFA